MRAAFYLIFVFCWVFSPLQTLGQDPELGDLGKEDSAKSYISQPQRIEFEIDKKDENFTVIPAEEDGLLVVTESRNKSKEGFLWKFNMLDTALNVQWSKELPIDFGADFRGYDYSLGNIFLLFVDSPYKKEEMSLLQFNVASGDTAHYDISTVFPIDLTYFEVVDHTIILGGIANDRPVALTFNVFEKKPKVLPGYYNNNSEILDIVIDDLTKTFTIIRLERLQNRRYTVVSNTYDAQGNEIQELQLKPEPDKSFLDGVSTTMDNGDQFIAGTFARKKSDYSRGLYLANIENGRQNIVQYHSYADLTNFFSYMRAKRENRIKERIERRKIKGKKTRFKYRLLVHELIDRGDEYILVGEAYYPKYSNVGIANPFYNSIWDQQRQSWYNPGFLGYKYTHAVVVSFSRSGQVKWDNSFEINDVLSLNLKENVQVSVDDDQVVLLYLYEGSIRTKIVSGNKIIEGKTYNPVQLKFEDDELKDNNKNVEGLEKWYGKSFFAHGIQEIRNMKDKEVKLDREIFYINKIIY